MKNDNEVNYIKRKVSSLIIEIVKRQWPQLWTDFLDEIFQISKIDSLRQEIATFIIDELFTQISFDLIHPLTRRMEIAKAFAKSEIKIRNFLAKLLYSSLDTNNVAMINYLLKIFSTLFNICHLDSLVQEDFVAEFYPRVTFLITKELFTFEALSCLDSLVNVFISKGKQALNAQFFSSTIFDDVSLKEIYTLHEYLQV